MSCKPCTRPTGKPPRPSAACQPLPYITYSKRRSDPADQPGRPGRRPGLLLLNAAYLFSFGVRPEKQPQTDIDLSSSSATELKILLDLPLSGRLRSLTN